MSHTLTEGGQITSHRLRMLRQVIKVACIGAFFVGIGVFVFLMSKIPVTAYYALWYHLKALIFAGIYQDMEVSHKFISELAQTKIQYQINGTLPLDYIIKSTTPVVDRLAQETYVNFLRALTSSGISFGIILTFFFYRGRLAKAKKHISGPKVISSKWLGLWQKLKGNASPIKLGHLHMIKGTETQHILITGGTGSGKTNCLHHLLSQIRLRDQKTIIIDTSGVFLDRYFINGKDHLLNPFDDRGVAWNPWAEGCSAADFASLAEAFIPSSYSDNENYWRLASKIVMISLLQKFSDTQKTSELTRWLQFESLSNLCKLVQGTKAAAHMDLSSEKTASSIRSVACTFLECLENLRDTPAPFSIRKWMTKEDGSWLFLQCTPAQRSILRPLLAAWLSSAVRGLLDLPIDINRRIWFSIDELPSMQRVKDLETLLTEGRKYGGCGILTLQSPAQLENIYGRDVAKVIIGNTSTKIIFRESNPEIAEGISKAFGEREVQEIQEGISYGAHETRDGVNLSMQNRFRPVVTPTQLLELPINTAYIKLAEERAVSLVKFPLNTRNNS